MNRHRRALIGFIILTIGLAFAVHRTDAKDNTTRCEVVALIVRFTENSARSANATLNSPTATAEQKRAASQNLASVQAALQSARDVLGHPHGTACGGNTVPGTFPTTTTTPRKGTP